jgi:predicted flap endonuclease-1-like 5' DNA nuclease
MLYLASQFVWFLAAAFALGLAMGWISHDGGRLRLGGAVVGWFAALWGLGAALTWLQFLNGEPAIWVETALLFTAVYVAGCVVAGLLRGERAPAEAITDTAAAPAAALPPVDGEAAIPGQRPSGFVAARDDKPDDLKLIKGVGRQNEARLHRLGIWHFEQIAAWTSRNVEWVGSYLAFPGRIEREDWVGQAKTLAAGGETDFAKRAKAGLVETSRDDEAATEDKVADGASDETAGHSAGKPAA